MALPLRGGRIRAWPLRKSNFFWSSKKIPTRQGFSDRATKTGFFAASPIILILNSSLVGRKRIRVVFPGGTRFFWTVVSGFITVESGFIHSRIRFNLEFRIRIWFFLEGRIGILQPDPQCWSIGRSKNFSFPLFYFYFFLNICCYNIYF